MGATDGQLRDRVAISGVGCTEFGALWDRSTDNLVAEAALAACASVGISLDDIDAFWIGTERSGDSGLTLTRSLKVGYKPVTRVENAGATGLETLRMAFYGVASGAYDTVMALGVDKMSDSYFQTEGPIAEHSDPVALAMQLELWAEAYSREYGVSRNDIASALAHRGAHAGSDPMPADGAAAAILSRTSPQNKSDSITIKALTSVTGSLAAPSGLPSAAISRSAQSAYRSAGIANPLSAFAVAEVPNVPPLLELVLVEELGLVQRGSVFKMVMDGELDTGGRLPINSDSGIAAVGPVPGASGLRALCECWRQVLGIAGNRQVAMWDGAMALVHDFGGTLECAVSTVAVLGRP